MTSLNDNIFEAIGEFAMTIQCLVKDGWSFKIEYGDRYASPKIIATLGDVEKTCYDTEDVEDLLSKSRG